MLLFNSLVVTRPGGAHGKKVTRNRILQSKSTKCDGKGKSCAPSIEPSAFPSDYPSAKPSDAPSVQPSQQPSVCQDEPGWQVGGSSKFATMTCSDINGQVDGWCKLIQDIGDAQYAGKSISEACCDCGGGDHQVVSPSTSPTETPSESQEPSYHEFPSVEPSMQPSTCQDETGWHVVTQVLSDGTSIDVTCSWLGENENLCELFRDSYHDAKNVFLACCLCGGGDHRSVAPSGLPTTTPTSYPSSEPSISMNPSDAPSELPSISPSDTPTGIPSSTPSVSVKPSQFPSRVFGATYDGESCNYDRECKERPLYPTLITENERCELRKRRIPTKLPTSAPSEHPSVFPSVSSMPSVSDAPSKSFLPSASPIARDSLMERNLNALSPVFPSEDTFIVKKNENKYFGKAKRTFTQQNEGITILEFDVPPSSDIVGCLQVTVQDSPGGLDNRSRYFQLRQPGSNNLPQSFESKIKWSDSDLSSLVDDSLEVATLSIPTNGDAPSQGTKFYFDISSVAAVNDKYTFFLLGTVNDARTDFYTKEKTPTNQPTNKYQDKWPQLLFVNCPSSTPHTASPIGKKGSKKSKSSKAPSDTPSLMPSSLPSSTPSVSTFPSVSPSNEPSSSPSDEPSTNPSTYPSDQPSSTPSSSPSSQPSGVPSSIPSDTPSDQPSVVPSLSSLPSTSPSAVPSTRPSSIPTLSSEPSMEPSPTRNEGQCINKMCEAEVSTSSH